MTIKKKMGKGARKKERKRVKKKVRNTSKSGQPSQGGAIPVTPEEPERQPHKLGLVHVYTGNGKGKTTASLGLALRASGHGMKVLIIQFMKGGKHIGELMAIGERLPNIELSQFGKPCTYSDHLKKGLAECGNCRDCFLTEEEEKEKAEAGMRAAEEASKSASYDILILDEINIVLSKRQVLIAPNIPLHKHF